MPTRVAYVVSRFPKMSETFIVDEIHALERQGVDVELLAFIRGREGVVQSASQALAGRATYPATGGAAWLGAIAYWALRRPAVFFQAVATVVATHLASPRNLVRAVAATAHAATFARVVEARGMTHVHAHWATHTATCAWVVHRLTGLPFTFTAHADDVFVRRPMLPRKARDAAFVVAISGFTRAALEAQIGSGAPARIEVVHCGLDLSDYAPTPLPHGERFEIASVARLEPKKGLVDLVDACRVLRDRGLDLRCRVIGEGRERARIEARVREHGLEGVFELLGAKRREEVHALLRDAHVMALPAIVDAEGRADGIPVAMLEAQALALPCVATRVSGIPELIEHEGNGLLVEPGDVPALAGALERLAGDRDLAARLGEQGRACVRAGFDVDVSAARLRSLFESLPGAAPAVATPSASVSAAVPGGEGAS